MTGALTADEGRPVIAGFASDPSICRVGDSYYVVHSSFEYSPGIPLWTSDNLTEWRLLGNVLDRESQLELPAMSTWLDGSPVGPPGVVLQSGAGSTGLFAPTIRHHEGRFWVTVTNINVAERGPLIVSAEDPAGPWTEPVYVSGLRGIDSDLVWDDEGHCYMALSSYEGGAPRIRCARIDPTTGTRLGDPFDLWQGTGGLAPEAPHLFRRAEWWYLTLAEGGTERTHAVTVARSKSLYGPWEPAPHNPILTHRGIEHPVQNTGHGDLVETPDGEWAMVYLGARPRGVTAGFYVNGRETFLAGISWVDGWPVVDETAYPVPEPAHDFRDDFESSLHPRWVSPGTAPLAFVETGAEGALLTADDHTRLLVCRTRDEHWCAEVDADARAGDGGIHLRLDEAHFVEVVIVDGELTSRIRIGSLERVRRHGVVPSRMGRIGIRTGTSDSIALLRRGPDVIELFVAENDKRSVLDRIDGRYFSTEVAGGWTGRMIGVTARSGVLRVATFSYTATTGETTS